MGTIRSAKSLNPEDYDENNKTLLTILLAVALLAPTSRRAGMPTMRKKAEEAVAEFLKADSDLQAFFDKAYGYAVFYSVGKGAIGVGGAHGKGVVYAQGTATGNSKLTQVIHRLPARRAVLQGNHLL